ncbi:hypothetical protein VKT23_017229 [Stygiomarasmius scandens]|uniref:Uncharacterized protein n=1 Tax=Marasmiellus scandens TaxID=2682957 RepID=A0ABR1ISM6_9AGAR
MADMLDPHTASLFLQFQRFQQFQNLVPLLSNDTTTPSVATTGERDTGVVQHQPPPQNQPQIQVVPLTQTQSQPVVPLTQNQTQPPPSTQPLIQTQIPSFSESQPAPPIIPYRSVRQPTSLGHPSIAPQPTQPSLAAVASSATPFRDGGFRSLIPQVDAVRRETAALHRSQEPVLPRRHQRQSQPSGNAQRRRGRGAAVPTPVLGRRQAPQTINDTIATLPSGEQVCRIEITIYLRDPEGYNNRVIYHLARANVVEAFRSKMNLDHKLHVSLETPLSSLMDAIRNELVRCPQEYELPDTTHDALGRPEPLFLLLEFTNAGRRGSRSNILYLRPTRADVSMTISDLFNIRNVAQVPNLAVKEGYFQLHFMLDVDEIQAKFSLLEAGLGTDPVIRRHKCLSARFHYEHYYGADQRNPVPAYETGLCLCNLDAENDSEAGESSILDEEMPPEELNPRSNVSPPILPLPSNNVSDLYPVIPASLFQSSFPPTEENFPHLTNMSQRQCRHVVDFASTVYAAANAGVSRSTLLDISGDTVEMAAKKLLSMVREAVNSGDFHAILSERRIFEVGTRGGQLSIGDGVEGEVVSLAWKIVSADQHSSVFRMTSGDRCSIVCSSPMVISGILPASRREQMCILGAMAAVMICYGKYPAPLSPAILQFLIHGGDPRSIDRDFVQEWLPELYADLNRYQEIGPGGDLSSFEPMFSSFTTLTTASLKLRSPEFHDAIGAYALYQSTVSLEPPMHPEIVSFVNGFRLKCSNGFELGKAIRLCFIGGSSAFLSQLSLTHVADYGSVKDHLRVETPHNHVVQAISNALGSPFVFKDFLEDFLRNTGIPCPELWRDAQSHFNPCVINQLSSIEKVFYRPQMFIWASTGSPEIRPDLIDGNVRVLLVDENDDHYIDGNSSDPVQIRLRQIYLEEGKISFRTCSMVVRVPGMYIKNLIDQCHADNVSVLPRLHHWLLCEVLNAIGKHSML